MGVIGKPWTEEEDRKLKESAGILTAKEIATMMGERTYHAVNRRAQKLGISLSKYVLSPDLGISAFRVNGWSVCRMQNECVHPNAGNLTKDDYYKMNRSLDGYCYDCKKCYMKKMKKNGDKKTGRNYQVCRSVTCQNPKNGSLTKQDYHLIDRVKSNGERGRTVKCKQCLDKDKKKKISPKAFCHNDRCRNERNGSLTENDYERYSSTRLSKLCKQCLDEKRKAEIMDESNLDFSDVINSSFVQRWLCGQIPC